MRRTLGVLFCLTACSSDTSTVINVAPSAEPRMEAVLEAVERLNAMTGEETFTVRAVDSEERIDGEVIVRLVPTLGFANGNELRLGNTRRTPRGVIVRIIPRTSPAAIAHELGHAAGLQHVDDEGNLMFRASRPGVWDLNEIQLAVLRGLSDASALD